VRGFDLHSGRESDVVSLGEQLDKYRGFGPGFDFLRIFLALSVVAWHSFNLAKDGIDLEHVSIVWFAGYAILFTFFALSGFLIAGSAQRLSLPNFLINRGLRIFPALVVEVLLSAFILGLIFTSLAPLEYLSRLETYRYLTNIVGLMNFRLPGVFEHNELPLVNYSLWTVPYEFACYFIMSAFISFGVLRRPMLIIALATTLSIVGLAMVLHGVTPPVAGEESLGKALYSFFADRGSRLLVAFMLGIAAYLLRYRIPYSHLCFGLCVAFLFGVAIIGPRDWLSIPFLNVVASAPLVYVMAYLGASPLPLPAVLHERDYSYGIYLYGMPIQQMMISLFPEVTSPVGQLALAIPCIVGFAALSWQLVELPVLRQRRRFSFVARVRVVDDTAPAPVDGRAIVTHS
jgi:peptidoglycan/LPS O-acetylase OafA/YrhL